MSFVCLIRTTAFGVSILFLPSQYGALRDEGHLRGNGKVLTPLSRKMKATILDRGLLTFIKNCAVDSVAALLAFARAHEMDWSNSEASGCHQYDFASAIIVAIPEWNADSCRWVRSGDPLPGTVYPKVALKYI